MSETKHTYKVSLAPTNKLKSFEGEFYIRRDFDSTPKKYSNGFHAALSLVQRIRAGVMTKEDVVLEWSVSAMPEFIEAYQKILNEKKGSKLEILAEQQITVQ
ncbi:MAG: hypothetical protein AABW88_03585 [Nanoarchaeota archaeon]